MKTLLVMSAILFSTQAMANPAYSRICTIISANSANPISLQISYNMWTDGAYANQEVTIDSQKYDQYIVSTTLAKTGLMTYTLDDKSTLSLIDLTDKDISQFSKIEWTKAGDKTLTGICGPALYGM